MYGEFQTPAPSTSNGAANSASGNRRSVRHSVSSDQKDSPWHFRDSELFLEDLDAEQSSVFDGHFQHEDGQNRTRRQANNRNTNNSKDKDNKYSYHSIFVVHFRTRLLFDLLKFSQI